MAARSSLLLFDVFGTLVDWYGSLAREVADLVEQRGWSLDVAAFVIDWRRAYFSGTSAVRNGELPWTDVDALNADSARRLLSASGVHPSEGDLECLVSGWRRLDPWADTVEGMTRLRSRHTLAPLSNGSVSLLTELARHAGLPFDRILGSDLFRAYKPAPETYLGALKLLEGKPAETIMVAVHNYDLLAAASHGLRTAFVRRPLEWGGQQPTEEADPSVDMAVETLVDLAERLGC
jgi:2-haloacid dehalogenase